MKVEKDWWQKDKEKLERRIARKVEREAKDKQLEDVVAKNAKTNAKMLKMQEESKAQFFELNSQVALLLQAMNSQNS